MPTRWHATHLLLALLALAAHRRHPLLPGGFGGGPVMASAAVGVPDPGSDFAVLGVPFRNRSLGLGGAFAELGHQVCLQCAIYNFTTLVADGACSKQQCMFQVNTAGVAHAVTDWFGMPAAPVTRYSVTPPNRPWLEQTC
jgi:hypothetical protein